MKRFEWMRKLCDQGQLMVPMVLILVAAGFAGCSLKMDNEVVDRPDHGFYMELPKGWVTNTSGADTQRKMFFDLKRKKNNYGNVQFHPREGSTLSQFVEYNLSNSNYSELVSQNKVKVRGRPAVQVIYKVDMPGATVDEVFIHNGDTFIQVTFRLITEDFERQFKRINKTFKSIKLK